MFSHCKVALATTHPPVLQQYLRKAAAANCTVAATNISSFEVINTCGCRSSVTTTTDRDSVSLLQLFSLPIPSEGWNSSVGTASDRKARCNTNEGSIPWCSKGFFSQAQLSVQTLVRCPYSPHVQSHASTSVHMLKILNTGSHTTVWTYENTTHAGRNR